jgi:hypothetical protein
MFALAKAQPRRYPNFPIREARSIFREGRVLRARNIEFGDQGLAALAPPEKCRTDT